MYFSQKQIKKICVNLQEKFKKIYIVAYYKNDKRNILQMFIIDFFVL